MRRRLFLFALSAAVSMVATLAIGWLAVLRPMRRTWGVDPGEDVRPLPGDDLVPGAPLVETRGITVEAPAAAIWPWLVQMGYGRGGWYSYDRMDNDAASADRVLAEFQSLSVGDVMPTWPGGGFQVVAMDPGRSLVLYLDTPIVKAQQASAEQSLPEPVTPGIKAAGAMGDAAMPEFRATWAFSLEPIDEHRTRVVERLRAWTPDAAGMQKLALPVLGMGVFLMTRKQLLGLKERVERYQAAAAAGAEPEPMIPPAPEPAPVDLSGSVATTA